jgi:Flp pilus assembly protein TadG
MTSLLADCHKRGVEMHRSQVGSRPTSSPHSHERGQVLPFMALAMVAIVAMVALVLEGGNAFAQQRITQNAADAAANAGAVVLAERLGGAVRTDGNVQTAVNQVATANTLLAPVAYYTDIGGRLLASDGSFAASKASAKVVGSGDPIPSNTAGVQAGGTRSFDTFFAGVLGFGQFNASAEATVVTGILDGICPAEAGCGILPVTFPVLVETCDGQSDLIPGENEWAIVGIDARTGANEAIVPLCTTAPGSVGWLDLGPGNLAQEIVTPTNGSFDLPTWLQTQPGNVSSVESEINDNYAGEIVLIPMFDGTCRVQPAGTALSDCPNGQEGVGNNSWYHIPKFTAFFLDEAFVQGNVTGPCNSAPGSPFVGGNGAVNCLKGWFTRYITQGPVISGPIDPANPTAIGIQLIR